VPDPKARGMSDDAPLDYHEVYPDGNDGTGAGTATIDIPEDGELVAPVDASLIMVAPPSAPLDNAKLFVQARFAHSDRDLLVHRGGSFDAWDGRCWPALEERALRSWIYKAFSEASYLDARGEVKPFEPSKRKVDDIVDGLKAAVHVSENLTAPAWLGRDGPVRAREQLAVANGLLHVPTRTLYEHTPRFYVAWSLPYPFDENAPAPTRWFRFLDEIWGDDDESKATLAEVFGYMLGGSTTQQKLFMLVGPKRSGKGTIARVLAALLGRHNIAGPTLSSLSTNFGLQPLVGKPVAVIADARLHSEDAVIVERLLSISGEDTLTIDRKYREHWTGKLPTRFLLISNETPRLHDSSGALASRLVIITMATSFYGREDPRLTDTLLGELPGILTWALDGLDRLNARGHFVQPKAAVEIQRELEDLGSPVGAFVRDCCVVGPGHSAPVSALWQEWRRWCATQGRDHHGTRQTFGRDLRAAVPGLRTTQPRAGDVRYREYEGIALAAHDEEP
jgi:putative DNA primase/helicase